MNSVTFNVEVTPENKAKIEKITALLFSGKAGEVVLEKTSETKPGKDETKESTSQHKDAVEAAKKAKGEHGVEFIAKVLDEMKVKDSPHVGRRISAIDPSKFAEFISKIKEGPKKVEADDGLDDDLDDGLRDYHPEITSDSVKIALKAYAKKDGRDAAKAVMAEYNVESLNKIDDCTDEQLAGIFKKIS